MKEAVNWYGIGAHRLIVFENIPTLSPFFVLQLSSLLLLDRYKATRSILLFLLLFVGRRKKDSVEEEPTRHDRFYK